MKAVVLAAGQGERMLPLTKDKPKALVELHGKPLLWHVLDSLEKAGVKETVIVVGFKGEMVKAAFGGSFGKMKLEYAVQNSPMGTAHAVFQARKIVKGKFLVGYCDVIVQPELWKKLQRKIGFAVVAALREEKNPERFGVALAGGGKLLRIIEKPAEKVRSRLVNVGAYLFNDSIFPRLEKVKISSRGEFELTDAINAIAEDAKAGFVVYNGKCLDIGSPEDLENAESGKD